MRVGTDRRARLDYGDALARLGSVVVSTLSVVMNAAPRSRAERRVWLSVALVMLASSLVEVLTAG